MVFACFFCMMCIVYGFVSCRIFFHYSLIRKKRMDKKYSKKKQKTLYDVRKRMKGTEKHEMRKKERQNDD